MLIYDQIQQGQYKILRKAIRDGQDDEIDYYYVAQLTAERNNVFGLRWLAKNIGPTIILNQVDELMQIAEKHGEPGKSLCAWLRRQVRVNDKEALVRIYKLWLSGQYYDLS